jgi:hypothetical protein
MTFKAEAPPETEKPAAGGGAAGFPKEPNSGWEEECRYSYRGPGRRIGALNVEERGRRCVLR